MKILISQKEYYEKVLHVAQNIVPALIGDNPDVDLVKEAQKQKLASLSVSLAKAVMTEIGYEPNRGSTSTNTGIISRKQLMKDKERSSSPKLELETKKAAPKKEESKKEESHELEIELESKTESKKELDETTDSADDAKEIDLEMDSEVETQETSEDDNKLSWDDEEINDGFTDEETGLFLKPAPMKRIPINADDDDEGSEEDKE